MTWAGFYPKSQELFSSQNNDYFWSLASDIMWQLSLLNPHLTSLLSVYGRIVSMEKNGSYVTTYIFIRQLQRSNQLRSTLTKWRYLDEVPTKRSNQGVTIWYPGVQGVSQLCLHWSGDIRTCNLIGQKLWSKRVKRSNESAFSGFVLYSNRVDGVVGVIISWFSLQISIYNL